MYQQYLDQKEDRSCSPQRNQLNNNKFDVFFQEKQIQQQKNDEEEEGNLFFQKHNYNYDNKSVTNKQKQKQVSIQTFEIFLTDRQIQIKLNEGSSIKELFDSVLSIAKQLNSSDFSKISCLASLDDNELIDFWLLNKSNQASCLDDKIPLRALYSENIQQIDPMKINHFKFIKCLGKGGTSEVFLVRHKTSSKLFALKMIKKSHLSDYKRLEQLLRERKILIEAKENNFIAKLYACFESDYHLNFLLEFYPGGELFFHLQNKRLNEDESRFYFAQVVVCFEQLHKQKILYRDLKPENIVLDIDGNLRLTDFGLSKIGLGLDEVTDSFCGSPEYMAPEVLKRQGYNYSVDFYTMGAFLFELATGLPPYYSNSTEKILKNIANNDLEIPSYLSEDLQDLLTSLLDKDPNNRVITFEHLKSFGWLQGIDWTKVNKKSLQPPIQINIYRNYLHPEFSQIEVPDSDQECNNNEELFSFFNYISQEEKIQLLQINSLQNAQQQELKQLKAQQQIQEFQNQNQQSSQDSNCLEILNKRTEKQNYNQIPDQIQNFNIIFSNEEPQFVEKKQFKKANSNGYLYKDKVVQSQSVSNTNMQNIFQKQRQQQSQHENDQNLIISQSILENSFNQNKKNLSQKSSISIKNFSINKELNSKINTAKIIQNMSSCHDSQASHSHRNNNFQQNNKSIAAQVHSSSNQNRLTTEPNNPNSKRYSLQKDIKNKIDSDKRQKSNDQNNSNSQQIKKKNSLSVLKNSLKKLAQLSKNYHHNMSKQNKNQMLSPSPTNKNKNLSKQSTTKQTINLSSNLFSHFLSPQNQKHINNLNTNKNKPQSAKLIKQQVGGQQQQVAGQKSNHNGNKKLIDQVFQSIQHYCSPFSKKNQMVEESNYKDQSQPFQNIFFNNYSNNIENNESVSNTNNNFTQDLIDSIQSNSQKNSQKQDFGSINQIFLNKNKQKPIQTNFNKVNFNNNNLTNNINSANNNSNENNKMKFFKKSSTNSLRASHEIFSNQNQNSQDKENNKNLNNVPNVSNNYQKPLQNKQNNQNFKTLNTQQIKKLNSNKFDYYGIVQNN